MPASPTGRRIWIPPVSLVDLCEDDLHVLLWQVRGESDVVLADGTRPLAAGHAMWISAGVPHDVAVHEDSVMTPVFFEASRTATTLTDTTVVAVDRDLRTLMLASVAAWGTAIEHSVDIGRQILALAEDRPAQAGGLPMPDVEPARGIAERLRFDPGDPRSVEELAESVHTSARSVERSFRAGTGMTLREWRIRNRMEAAATLLRSHASVGAVAIRVGYTNVNAFRRVFQARFGMSPTAYAERYAAQ